MITEDTAEHRAGRRFNLVLCALYGRIICLNICWSDLV